MLLSPSGSFVAVDIMHRFSVEFCSVFGWVLAACWVGAVIAVSIVQMMIYVAVKVFWAVEPGSYADENAA